jgi:putative nucleotidyltransferase with HDIG domain
LFSSVSLRDLWRHSLEVARVCERLATSAHGVNREEAFLAGLVHDIGRLTISRLPGARAAYGRLLEKGCEPVIAELFLLGCDHGETGAEVLRLWDFPVHLVDAVANHHQPENARNQLALLLHLAESRCAPEESMPSPVLRGAMDKVGVAPDFLESMDNGVGELECLVGVA